MTAVTERPKVAIYARLSSDVRMGTDREGENVEFQVSQARRFAEARGLDVVDVFEENNASAGKYRPEFEELRRRVEAGDFEALVVHKADRLTRSVKELESHIDVAERLPGGVVATHASSLDFSTASGRAQARQLIVWAQMEREQTKERVQVAKDRLRAEGRFVGTGQRPYGFEAEYLGEKTATGRERFRLTGRLDEREAALLREAAERILSGASLLGTSRWLASEGLSTSNGRMLSVAHLRRILLNPRTAGLSARTVGANAEKWEVIGPGQWDAILSPETQDRLRLVLEDPSRKRRGGRVSRSGGRSRWWLRGSLVCGECGEKLAPMYRYGSESASSVGNYFCDKSKGGCSKVSISKEKAEAYVRAILVETATGDLPRLAAAESDALSESIARRTELLRQLSDLGAIRQRLAADLGSGALGYDEGQAALAGNTARAEALRSELGEIAADASTGGGLSLLADLQAGADLSEEALAQLSKALFERIVLSTAGKRKLPVEERLEVVVRS